MVCEQPHCRQLTDAADHHVRSGIGDSPRSLFPDIDVPIITVTVPYLGAAPEEVEQGVCIRIEEELGRHEGIEQIRSNANEGTCSVQVELLEEADELKALDDVKSRVDAIDTFPEETEKTYCQFDIGGPARVGYRHHRSPGRANP